MNLKKQTNKQTNNINKYGGLRKLCSADQNAACQKSILTDFLQKPYSVTIKETYKSHEYLTNVNLQLYAYILYIYYLYNGIGKTDNIILSIRIDTYIAYLRMGDKRGIIYIYVLYTNSGAHKRGKSVVWPSSWAPRF